MGAFPQPWKFFISDVLVNATYILSVLIFARLPISIIFQDKSWVTRLYFSILLRDKMEDLAEERGRDNTGGHWEEMVCLFLKKGEAGQFIKIDQVNEKGNSLVDQRYQRLGRYLSFHHNFLLLVSEVFHNPLPEERPRHHLHSLPHSSPPDFSLFSKWKLHEGKNLYLPLHWLHRASYSAWHTIDTQ